MSLVKGDESFRKRAGGCEFQGSVKDAAFLLTIGSFLLTVGLFLPTVDTLSFFYLQLELFCLQWESASNKGLEGL